jgi:uncharacterized protein (DUF58 family)
MDIIAAKASRGGWLSRLLSLRPRGEAQAAESEQVFSPEFTASLERLRLAALKALGGGLREGHRLGAYKGGQLEFHGHRNYVPGDELRYVDWNTYARLGKPFVKEFAREEAGVLHLLLDGTPSMSLGRPDKWTFARRLAALFIHVALASKDIVQLHVFRGGAGSESLELLEQFPARGAKGSIREYLAFLARCEVAPPGALASASGNEPGAGKEPEAGCFAEAAAEFLRRNPARGRVIIVGDFWHEEAEIVTAISRLASAGFDVSGIQVLSPEELLPPDAGVLLARSVEDSSEIALYGGAELPARYTREFEAHRGAIEAAFRHRGGNYLLERCDASIEKVLINTLRQRRWVM